MVGSFIIDYISIQGFLIYYSKIINGAMIFIEVRLPALGTGTTLWIFQHYGLGLRITCQIATYQRVTIS